MSDPIADESTVGTDSERSRSGPVPGTTRNAPILPIIGDNESIIAISSFWARHGQRGAGYVVPSRRKDDPLYRARRTLHTGADLLTTKQTQRLHDLFTTDEHVQVEATWGIYQRMIAAYRAPDRTRGRALMTDLVESLRHGVPAALSELHTLGRTLNTRAADVLAYFDRPGTEMADRCPAPASSLLYEGATHSLAGSPAAVVGPYFRTEIADWLADRVDGVPADSGHERVTRDGHVEPAR